MEFQPSPGNRSPASRESPNRVFFASAKPEAPPHVERFRRVNAASDQLTEVISRELDARGVEKRYALGASVFFLPESLDLPEDADLATVLTSAREHGAEVVVYNGGINWRGGKQLHETEFHSSGDEIRKSRLIAMSEDMSSDFFMDLSPDAKKSEVRRSALNFLAETGKSVVITVDPVLRIGEVNASDLRADAIARESIFREIRKHGNDALCVNWSDGGFKDIQIQFSGFISLAEDIRHAITGGKLSVPEILKFRSMSRLDQESRESLWQVLAAVHDEKVAAGERPAYPKGIHGRSVPDVFSGGIEALSYFSSQHGVDNIKGGSPAVPEELAFPFRSTDENPVKRTFLRQTANRLVKFFGKHESNQLLRAIVYGALPKNTLDQVGNITVLSRLLELGRGQMTRSDLNPDEASAMIARNLIADAMGDAVDLTLGDTSGDVVDTARDTIGTPTLSRLIHGETALYVETRDNPGAPARHLEVKRALPELERLIAAHKLGLISDSPWSDGPVPRYLPVHLVEDEKSHPNGSKLHVPKSFDREKYNRLVTASGQSGSDDREIQRLIRLASPIFAALVDGQERVVSTE